MSTTTARIVQLLCGALLFLAAAEARHGTAGVSLVECSEELVYPYTDFCDNPAQYILNDPQATYNIASAADWSLALAPEWDEKNATYYVRLSDTGANYGFTYITKEIRSAVALSATLLIINADSGRYLSWREEDGEKFLVETDSQRDFLRFNTSSTTLILPCPPILPPLACTVYDILSGDTSSDGLGAYVEDGITYFKEQSDAFPFVLHSATSSSSTSASSSFDHVLKLPTDH